MSNFATTTNEPITLKSADDWETWEASFISYADSAGLWKILKKEEKYLVQPLAPEYSVYHKITPTPAVPVAASQDSEGTVLGVVLYSDLTVVGQKAYDKDWTVYQDKKKDYTAQQEKVHNLKQWVRRTVSKNLLRTACPPERSLETWYSKLKEQVGTNSKDRKREGKLLYKQAMNQLTRVPRDFTGWVNNWEEAMIKAREYENSDAKDSFVWFPEFADAIRPVMRDWINPYEIHYTESIEAGDFSIRKAAHDLRLKIKLIGTKVARPIIARGAFGPIFAGEEAREGGDIDTVGFSAPFEDEEVIESTATPAKEKHGRTTATAIKRGNWGNRKRSRTEGTGISLTCPACHYPGHSLPNCLYVFPEKARGVFKARSDRMYETQHRIDHDATLRADIERIKGKKPKEVKKPKDESSTN